MKLDPQRVRLDSFAELEDATDRLLLLAQQRVAVFHIDLASPRWGGVLRHDALQNLLLASPANRLQIVLHDTDYLLRFHARIVDLLRRFSGRMEIRRSFEEAKHLSDPFVLVDGQHYLHQFHYQRMGGEFAVAQPEAARELALRFQELWDTAEPGLSATVLGL